MAAKYFCDRCGREIPLTASLKGGELIVREFGSLRSVKGDSWGIICVSCYKSLREWWEKR